MLDAMAGYNEADNDRIKVLASIVRTATLKLWNTQIIESDRIIDETEFWRFPWEKQDEVPGEKADSEELKRNADAQAEFLIKHFPDNGNSNKQS
jgi:hypothetical protein